MSVFVCPRHRNQIMHRVDGDTWTCDFCEAEKRGSIKPDDWHKRVRTTDPVTSKQAARAMDQKTRTKVQQNILNLFPEGVSVLMSHWTIVDVYRKEYGEHVPESTIRTRVSELVEGTLLFDSGKLEHRGGRKAILWGRPRA